MDGLTEERVQCIRLKIEFLLSLTLRNPVKSTTTRLLLEVEKNCSTAAGISGLCSLVSGEEWKRDEKNDAEREKMMKRKG